MPYCGKCLIEYVDGTAECEDCGAELLPGSPPHSPPPFDLTAEKDVKLVPARIFSGATAEMDAELARNILQTQGIASTIAGEGLADPFPVTEVRLLVSEEDTSHAERILQDYLDTNIPAAPEEPDPPVGA
jgi:putative signal transducing protein